MADISVQCDCGKELPETLVTTSYSNITINVETCDDCIERAKDENYSRGLEDGREENAS